MEQSLSTVFQRDPRLRRSRNRSFRACDACYTRRIKCDIQDSQCDWCRHHDTPCTFLRPHRRVWQAKGGRESNQCTSDSDTCSSMNSAPDPVARANSLAGMRNQPQLSSVNIRIQPEYPDHELLQQCVNEYERSRLRLIFPVIDPCLFRQTIEDVYCLSASQQAPAAVKACVLAFFDFFNTLRYGPNRALEYRRRYASSIQLLLPLLSHEAPSLEGLQVLIMMVFLAHLSEEEDFAADYLSVSVRFLFEMGAHISPSTAATRTDVHLRNLFWLCYTVDKDSFLLRTKRVSFIDDRVCDLSLPPGYTTCFLLNQVPASNSDTPFESALFPVDIRLSIIKSKIHRAFPSVGDRNGSVLQLLHGIRGLDEELESWRTSLPSTWGLTLLTDAESQNEDPNIDMFMLRMNYYSCVTIIHQASDKLKELVPPCLNLQRCVSLSFTLSLEASRSALLTLRTAIHAQPADQFGFIASYCLRATSTLFRNIMQNPEDVQAAHDLELIGVPLLVLEECDKKSFYVDQVAAHLRNLHTAAHIAIEFACVQPMLTTGN